MGRASLPTRIFGLATNVDRLLYSIGLVCSIGSGTILPLMTLIFGNFVTVFNDFAVRKLSDGSFMSQVSHYTLYFIYLFIAKLGLSYISMVCFTIVSTNVTATIQQQYLHAVLKQRIAFHETNLGAGRVNEALSTRSNTIRSGLADKFGMTVQHASTVVTALIVAMTSIWNLALAVASVIPAAVIVIGATSVLDEKMQEKITALREEASTIAEEVFSSIRTVRSLGATEKLFRKYQGLLKRSTTVAWRRAPIYGLQVGTYMFLLYAAYALAFWYGIRIFASGQIDQPGKVITTLFSIMIGMNSFSQLAAYLGSFMGIVSAGKDLFKTIDAPVAGTHSHVEPSTKDPTSWRDVFSQDIELTNVSFRYPTRPTVSVLNSLSLTASGSQQTAMVGQSGCGKSTIVGLLLRWYDVDAGTIRIGGVDIKDIPIKVLRSNIGFVSQEPQLFSGTIFENVTHGLIGTAFEYTSAEEKMKLVVDACKKAQAHGFINQLPSGYNTDVGGRGTQLSGGQKQRIAIARAIVKDPPILILDEATSALDSRSESLIQKAIDVAGHGRTTISIAHRLRTVQNADNIYVLGRGLVLEAGSHTSLTSSNDGLYRRLWDAQAMEAPENTDTQLQLAGKETLGVEESTFDKAEPISGPDLKRQPSDDTSHKGVFLTLLGVLSRYRGYWIAYCSLIICSVIAGGLYPVQAVLYAKVVESFQLTKSSLTSAGNFWGLMWFVLALVVAAGYFGLAALGLALGQVVSQDFRASYFRAFIRQPIAYFDEQRHSPSQLLSRLTTDLESIDQLAGGNISVIVTVATSLTSTVVLALATGWKFALVVLAGGLPFIFAASYIRERMEHTFEENAGKLFAECVAYAGECIQAIRTVSSLNMEPFVEDRFRDTLDNHRNRAKRYALRSMIWFALSESIELLCMALAFWYGGRLLTYEGYSTLQFFIVFIAIVFGSQSGGSYFAHSSDISKGVSAVNQIQQMEAGIESKEDFQLLHHQLPPEVGPDVPVFEFRNVDFSYPSRPEHQVLNNFSMKLYPGQFVAVVGESGSGKSTIMGLLQRFYDIKPGGKICVNGVALDKLSDEYLQGTFSPVSQEPVLYQGTLKENLLIGTGEQVTKEALDDILAICQLTDLISSLPDGDSTMVGSRGAALSGGQRQRVAIARALIRESSVLLLDEATSALDSLTERHIHEGLVARRLADKEKRGGILAIAHRLSTVKNADWIYVMHQGSVVEMGSHVELLARKGQYYRMDNMHESKENLQSISTPVEDAYKLRVISKCERFAGMSGGKI